MKEIKSLTGLRGIAAIYVILQHLHLDKIVHSNKLIAFFSHGYLAVDIFFMMSGFVMMASYGGKFTNGYNAYFKDYMFKRFVRIYPLYIVVLLMCFAVFAILKTNWIVHPSVLDYVTNILLLQIPFNRESFLYPSWSLSVEWCVYLIFPLLTMVTMRAKNYTTIVLMACAFILLWIVMYCTSYDVVHILTNPFQFIGGYLNLFKGWSALFKGLFEFFVGMCTFKFFQEKKLKRLLSMDILALVLIFLLLLVYNTDFYIVLLFPILIYLISHDFSLVGYLFSYKPIYYAGLWSYSIYLIHPLLIGKLLEKIRQQVESFVSSHLVSEICSVVLVIGLIIFISSLSYKFVEVGGEK